MMKRLNPHSIEVFLLDDADHVAETHVQDDVTLAFCSIAIGWAWTNLAETECYAHFSYTCPTETTFESLFLALLMVVGYYIVALYVFHRMMEGFRVKGRCRKVVSIEDGNGSRLFSDMDKFDEDADGVLDKAELTAYIAGEGLNVEPFLQAAAMVDQRDGIITGDVSIHELMEECDTLMDKIKAGKYIPGEFTMAELQVEGLREALARGEAPPTIGVGDDAINIEMMTSAVTGAVSGAVQEEEEL
jgi:hypothetical protein